ncbi:MAG: metallophosphoesterase [Candidatus Pacebacteria bacterium]|nr:metallophosphoesterase [Candidatus Paceibacterota bacterium]
MRIAIISDTHDNLPNFKKAIDLIKKEQIKTVIHCGDMGRPDTLRQILKGFSNKFFLVFGNVETDYFYEEEVICKEFPNLKIFPEIGEIEINNKKIAFCHVPKLAKVLAQTGKYNIVFYGHTHKPWEEKIGECRLVNPGNLSGIHYQSTFAVFDTKTNKLELKILQRLRA